MRILVVEDEVLLALALQTFLEEEGHDVLGPVRSVAEGLALATGDPPELALLNIDLKGGGSGIELARALRTRWGTPVLFTSGDFQAARAAADIAWGYIGKPYVAEVVLESVAVVEALLTGRPPAAVPRSLELFGVPSIGPAALPDRSGAEG